MLKLSSKIIRNMNKSVMNKLLNGNLKAFDPTMHKFILVLVKKKILGH
jgi:hypothetical protein